MQNCEIPIGTFISSATVNVFPQPAVLRVTLNRLSGTFRRHVSTGRHQTRPERAGSASELKPSETNATIAGVLCRRSLLVSTPPPTRLPFLLLEENGNGRLNRSGPSDPPGTMKTLEPGIRLSVTPVNGKTALPNKRTRAITLKRRY